MSERDAHLADMFKSPGWKVFVDEAIRQRLEWLNDLAEADLNSPAGAEIQAKIKALDGFIERPSMIVAQYEDAQEQIDPSGS